MAPSDAARRVLAAAIARGPGEEVEAWRMGAARAWAEANAHTLKAAERSALKSLDHAAETYARHVAGILGNYHRRVAALKEAGKA